MFQAIAIQVGVAWGLGVINRALSGKPQQPPPPRPDELDFPLTKVGTPIPLVYGTVKVENPVLVWGGNFSSTPQPSGIYKYSASCLFVLGTPPSKDLPGPSWSEPVMRALWIGDRRVELGSIPGGVLTHGNSQAFNFSMGGEANGGRFQGWIEFFDGRPDQVVTSYPSAATKRIDAAMRADSNVDATTIPGYRNQMLLGVIADTGTASDATFGESSHFPAIAAEISAVDGDAVGTVFANPAWVLYDLVCGYVFKLGYPTSKVDTASFAAAAPILVTEGNGCGVYVPTEDDIKNIANQLLAQMDGAVYWEPSTGLIKLRLIRSTDIVPGLRELNVDNTVGRPTVTQTGWLENVNQINVEFTNRAKQYKTDSIPAKRLANAVGQAYRPRPRTISYPYCMTAELASKLAARNAAIAGRPLMTCTAIVDRSFYDVTLGEPLTANWPQINVVDKVFRVLDVDLGQLADDKIKLTLVEDVFDNAFGAVEPPSGSPPDPDVLPILSRVFEEAPLWMTSQAYFQGWISDATTPRILNAAREEADQVADYFNGVTKTTGSYAADVPPIAMPVSARVATDYPASASPYDTVTGLVIESVSPSINVADYASDEEMVSIGANLILVGEVVDHVLIGGELMAFETMTDIGGGQYRLNNVWRELHDTASNDHPAGRHVFFLNVNHVGQRAWTRGSVITGKSMPVPALFTGDAPVDSENQITIIGDAISGVVSRSGRALRAADFCLNAVEAVTGTSGTPAPVTSYKRVDDFEGSLDAIWKQRNENPSSIVVRGDDTASYPVQDGALWRFYARKVGDSEQDIQGPLAIGSTSTVGLLVGKSGHGEIDVLLRTDGEFGPSWQDARVRVSAHRARNLLANGIAQYVAVSPWAVVGLGALAIDQGTTSLEQTANGRWFKATSVPVDQTQFIFEQVVDVTGYKARGLRARVVWYTRNTSADANDFSTVRIDDGSSTSTSSNIVGPTDHWRRAEHSMTLAAGTTQVTVRVTLNGASNDASKSIVTGLALYLDQASDELITNPSFDSGSTTSWTNVSNSFAANTGDITGYASRDGSGAKPVQGGAFASSEIKQEVSIPAGYEYGDAVLHFARANAFADDTGEVIVEVLNGGGSVIASSTTGALAYSTADGWIRGKLIVTLPDAAATLRVRLHATRTLGSGNSGAAFDDLSLRIHKDLDAVFERDLDFSAPQRAKLPTTWQHFYLAFPELAIPLVWNGDDGLPSARNVHAQFTATAAWSDASTPTPAKLVGYWTENRVDVASVDAYRFARAVAGSAVDLQVSEYGAFEKADTFSVAICFRVTERNMTLACGLAGRRDSSGHGWGLSLDTSGRVVATVSGTSTRTVTGTLDHRDGAPHWVLMTWNGTTLRVVDAAGSATNASDPGEFAVDDIVMRIGRAGTAEATGDIEIARVLVWVGAAIAEADFLDKIHRIGTDPNDLIDRETGWTISAPVWIQGDEDDDGATIVRCAPWHVPIGREGDDYGAIVVGENDNLAPSNVFSNATYFAAESSASLTQDIQDPTGLPRGVRVTNVINGKGLLVKAVPLGVTTDNPYIVFWARTPDASEQNVAVKLYDSDDNLIDSDAVVVTGLWQRFSVVLDWGGETATAYYKLSIDDNTAAFEIAHVFYIGFASPFGIQNPASSIDDSYGVVVETMPLQLHREGELQVDALMPGSPTQGATIVSVDNGTTDQKNQRALTVGTGTTIPKFTLWDNAASPTTVDGATNAWVSLRTVRGRWNTLELPEALGDQVGIVEGVAVSDSAALAFSVSTSVESENLRIGGGSPNGSTSPHALLQRVVLRAREEKL